MKSLLSLRYLYKIESKRLSYSRLLLNSGKSVLVACMESGFPDYSNYIRLFKKRFDINETFSTFGFHF